MTKEEILATKDWNSEYPNFMAESEILEAMDEYSQQQAIAFAEWINTNCLFQDGEKLWLKSECPEWGQKTSSELYKLWLQTTGQFE